MPTVTKSLGGGTQSVLLTMAILERLASQDGSVSISALARSIGTSKSRIFRHLQTLLSNDYVAIQGSNSEYVVGSRLMSFCRRITDRHDLVALARPVMEELRDQLGHSVILSKVDAGGVQVLKSIDGRSAIVVAVRTGTLLPLTTSAQGKAVLAFSREDFRERNNIVSEAYNHFINRHPGELEQIRRQGWAMAQMREGLIGFGAPVCDASGALVATLGLLDTTAEIGLNIREARGRRLVEAARKLSLRLSDGVMSD